MVKSFVKLLWGIFFVLVLGVAVLFVAIYNGWVGYMPPIEQLQNPINRYASQVYSADKKLLGTWSKERDNRVLVDYTNLPKSLVDALVATEDVRFYDHSGIDFYALGRAIIKRGIFQQKSAGGGSTLTQQLAKQLYSDHAANTFERMMQKPIEWVIAIKLERNYTKEEIITMYLNYFDFLHNAVGIKVASNVYFQKEPKDLTVPESAMLVGLCKNPSYFNPMRYPERCLERRNVVISQMEKAGYLTSTEADSYSSEPLAINYKKVDHKDGLAVYFRNFLRLYMMADKPDRSSYPSWNQDKYYMDSILWNVDPLYGWCKKNYNRDGRNYNIYTDGLKVYTTIDSRMQRYAENAVYKHVAGFLQPRFNAEKKGRPNAPFSDAITKKQAAQIMENSIRRSERYRVMKESGASDEEIKKAFNTKIPMSVFTYHGEVDTVMSPRDSIVYYKKFLRAGFMSMDAKNGYVKAYVGGLDFTHFAYDMASEGRRQVGSTIKPYLYALAMENGFSPCDMAPNVQQTYIVAGKPWTPRNASRSRYGQMVTLKWGLAQSNNWISAYLMSKLSPAGLVELMHKFGINNPAIHPSMSLCLGPCDITVQEMVSAYTAFANHGIRSAPMYVTRIEDADGNLLAEFQPRLNEVISSSSADKMLVLLKGVMDGGTGSRMRFKYNINCEMGGKTGTTNRNSDAWFIGFTPNLVNGVWVGGEDRDIHFDGMRMGQGATMALPIWAYYMQAVYADKTLTYSPEAKFELPEDFNPCVSDYSMDAVDGEGEEVNDIEEIYE